jgi:stage II sporulation protein E
VRIFGNRRKEENGDVAVRFAGTMNRYYVLLCDGMGSGPGAVQEGKTATQMLRRLLRSGYPAEHALQSLNSLCALRERAGAVTVDLLELELDTGKATLYKWGAAPSYLMDATESKKVGIAGPPPGLSVQRREERYRLSLRRGETLVMVSDGVGEEEALHCCRPGGSHRPGELATKLLTAGQMEGQDDATVITVRLHACASST